MEAGNQSFLSTEYRLGTGVGCFLVIMHKRKENKIRN